MFEWWDSLDIFNKSLMITSLMWLGLILIGQIFQKVEKIVDKHRKN